jgi:hypothetical protein
MRNFCRLIRNLQGYITLARDEDFQEKDQNRFLRNILRFTDEEVSKLNNIEVMNEIAKSKIIPRLVYENLSEIIPFYAWNNVAPRNIPTSDGLTTLTKQHQIMMNQKRKQRHQSPVIKKL